MNRCFSLLGLLLLPMTLTAADTKNVKTESLVLGGGCFWCTEAAYKLQPGVVHVTSGYAGGNYPNPTYEEVCSHETGHAEVIKIDYDPTVVSLETLLDFFWMVHDPTQVGGQGNDDGPQYRSIILYANDAQKMAAEKSRRAAQERFRDPITTEIVPLTKFWPAESYHQDYFARNPSQGYCRVVIAPKIDKLKSHLPAPK
ncbi:MAG: peptide-methionine (S)-S-oxide reductase MsrA [Verrucomicrobia bacterium]|nr:peptide-methionine (S)-S-oxide reductase MsrA [Verrucomicrobiota bacterium]